MAVCQMDKVVSTQPHVADLQECFSFRN